MHERMKSRNAKSFDVFNVWFFAVAVPLPSSSASLRQKAELDKRLKDIRTNPVDEVP